MKIKIGVSKDKKNITWFFVSKFYRKNIVKIAKKEKHHIIKPVGDILCKDQNSIKN